MTWQSFYAGSIPPWLYGFGTVLFAVVLVWSLVWKGLALWKAARLGSRPWFVALLIINTVGILEILYIYVFSKPKSQSVEAPRGPTV